MTKVTDGDPASAARTGRMPRVARRAQLLRVADGLFAERGYEATSMDDVAAAAEISKPVLYDHFGSKEGLFAACVEQVGDLLTERIDRAAADADGPEATLRAASRAYFGYAREQGSVLAVLLDPGPPPAAVILEQVLRIRRRQSELTIRLLRDSLAAEGLTIDDHRVEATAHALIGAYEGLTAWWYEHPDVDVDTLTEWFLDLVWPGLHQLLAPGPGGVGKRGADVSDRAATLVELVAGAAERGPDRLLLAGPDDAPLTYGDAWRAAGRIANALRAEGVGPGDRVAAQVEKSAGVVPLYLGCLRAGAVYLPMSAAYTPDEVGYLLGDAEPSLFVRDPDLAAVDADVRILSFDVDGAGPLTDLASTRARRGGRSAAGAERPCRAPLHERHDRAPQGRAPHARGPRGQRPRPARRLGVRRG